MMGNVLNAGPIKRILSAPGLMGDRWVQVFFQSLLKQKTFIDALTKPAKKSFCETRNEAGAAG